MKIIKNNIIPFGNYSTMNLFGLFFTKLDNLSPRIINHESIHTEQIKELGAVGVLVAFISHILFGTPLWYIILGASLFYIWYGVEYLFTRANNFMQTDAYHDISLEEEAHNNDDNLEYLKTRKHFAWLKYVKVNTYKRE